MNRCLESEKRPNRFTTPAYVTTKLNFEVGVVESLRQHIKSHCLECLKICIWLTRHFHYVAIEPHCNSP